MWITATYDSASSCYTAIKECLLGLKLGETITIDGMSCEGRNIHIKVVKDLINALGEDDGREFAIAVTEEVSESTDGWSVTTLRSLNVTRV